MEQIQTHDDGKTYVCHNDLNQGQTKRLGWPCNTAAHDLLRIYTRGNTQHQPGQATGPAQGNHLTPGQTYQRSDSSSRSKSAYT